jgi:hypothetical protein
MIKFEIKLGARHLNMEARLHKQELQQTVKGMHCRKCPGISTVISFTERAVNGESPASVVNFLVPVISSCCKDFEQRIRSALKGK